MKPIAYYMLAAILRAFPSRFRDRFGHEMLAAYLDQRDALQARGERPMAAAWRHDARTILGLLSTLGAKRREEQRQLRSLQDKLPRTESPMQNVLLDLRHALRGMRARPGFVVVAVLTLALGIGANTAVFSVLNSVVLAPLPYRDPGQLVRLYTANRERPDAKEFLPGLDIIDVRDQVAAFSSVGIMYTYRESGADLLTPDGHSQRVRVLPVSAEYFQTLGATPALGRTFTRDEERPNARAIILSHTLWASFSNSDPAFVGRWIDLNGERYEVVGVMRPSFADVTAPDIWAWIPQNLLREGTNSRGNFYLSAIGRLRPGTSVAQAQSQVTAFTRRLDEQFPADEPRRMRVVPLHEDIVGESSSAVYLLMGAAALVLLIACLNVANLFLARSVAQTRETAIRTALGAGRRRLIGQRLTESVAVALAGGLVGSATAYWGVKALLAVSPESLARAEELRFDPLLFAFAVAVTLLTGLLFGAAPAVRASRSDPNDALHDASRGNTAGRSSRHLRGALVASQVSVALVLLVGTGLLLKAFLGQLHRDLGFDSSNVATFEVNLPTARYDSADKRVRFHNAFGERLRGIPGVVSAGAVSWLPTNGKYHQWGYGYLDERGEKKSVPAQVRVVDGDYLKALGIPLLRGRAFNQEDRAGSPSVAMINKGLARRVYGDRDPIGQLFRTGGRFFTVIGVIGDVATDATWERGETLVLSHNQFADDRNWTLTYVVKSTLPMAQVIEGSRQALTELDPALVLYRPRTMDDVVAQHRARDRFVLLLMVTFGAVALTLAAVGVYGVLSYLVTQRNHEIGVRMALGARPAQVRAIVMRQGLVLAGGGVLIGLTFAAGLSGLLHSLASGVDAKDPLVFGAATLVLAVAVLLAGYLPTRRATKVSPLEALRND